MKIVAVDICFTLINKNTTLDFIDFFLKDNFKYKIFKIFAKFYQFLAPRHLRLLYIKQLAWYSQETLRNAVHRFFEQYNDCLNLGVIHKVWTYKNNYKIILVSASLDIIADYLCEKLWYDGFSASILEFKDWICTWKLLFDSSFWNKIIGMNLKFGSKSEKIAFFSDSYDDIDMFRLFPSNFLIVKNKIDKRFERDNLINNLEIIYV